jgi:hypothetical protein
LLFIESRLSVFRTSPEKLLANPVYLSGVPTVCIMNEPPVDSKMRWLIRSGGIQSFLSKTRG